MPNEELTVHPNNEVEFKQVGKDLIVSGEDT